MIKATGAVTLHFWQVTCLWRFRRLGYWKINSSNHDLFSEKFKFFSKYLPIFSLVIKFCSWYSTNYYLKNFPFHHFVFVFLARGEGGGISTFSEDDSSEIKGDRSTSDEAILESTMLELGIIRQSKILTTEKLINTAEFTHK